MSSFNNLDEPLNPEERMLYGINRRLEVLIDMFSSFLDVYAEEKRLATTSNTMVEEEVNEKVDDKVDYDSLSKKQISSILEYRGIEHNMRMSKDTLIDLL